ncbi:MAG: NAD(P)-dependent oxidoreductase [Betaproteobacteria bacterium]|nr:MAG: NAD(P)-dependent oxidoreductase [Betaproteobacteria bacterium]
MLQGKTLFITGASRGIGLAIALRAARDGANIVIAAKTTEPNPKLPGTIHSAAAEIERAGGAALPLQVDIRNEAAVQRAVELASTRFGGIDILVNNASAISLTGTLATPMKRFDLMFGVNVRGTYACSQACLPHLIASAAAGRTPHILTLAPPINLRPHWFKQHVAYTMAKYGMSMCVIGMAEEFRDAGVAVNALWPRTIIATSALAMIPGIADRLDNCRRPEILADAAHAILSRDGPQATGNFYIDEDVLAQDGVTDLTPYAVKPGAPLLPDIFLD